MSTPICDNDERRALCEDFAQRRLVTPLSRKAIAARRRAITRRLRHLAPTVALAIARDELVALAWLETGLLADEAAS